MDSRLELVKFSTRPPTNRPMPKVETPRMVEPAIAPRFAALLPVASLIPATLSPATAPVLKAVSVLAAAVLPIEARAVLLDRAMWYGILLSAVRAALVEQYAAKAVAVPADALMMPFNRIVAPIEAFLSSSLLICGIETLPRSISLNLPERLVPVHLKRPRLRSTAGQ